jgi:hypothetical protein
VPTPGACEFCGHRKLSEGICQCPPDCPSCHQGCCGQINIAALPHANVVTAQPRRFPDIDAEIIEA